MESSVSKFQSAVVVLLREAFEGRAEGLNYTWFIEGREGLFDALDRVDARTASIRPGPTAPSLAAHAFHVLFLLRGANMCQGRPAPEGTWETSWERNEVDEVEWRELGQRIRAEALDYLSWYDANTDWSFEGGEIATMAPLPHIAYHVGAMRQIIRALAASS